MSIDPIGLLIYPLALALIVIFVAAVLYDFTVFRRRKKTGKAVYRCNACRHIYAEMHRTPLARCPKCGNSNEPVRK